MLIRIFKSKASAKHSAEAFRMLCGFICCNKNEFEVDCKQHHVRTVIKNREPA